MTIISRHESPRFMATDRGAPDTEGPRQQTAMIGRFSGLRIVLLTAPSPQGCPMHQRHRTRPANGSLRRSSPITAAGPRWIFTTFPLTSAEADTEIANYSIVKVQDFSPAHGSLPQSTPGVNTDSPVTLAAGPRSRRACWTRAPRASGAAIGGGARPCGASPRRGGPSGASDLGSRLEHQPTPDCTCPL